MSSERLLKLALKQVSLILTVLIAIPVSGVIATLLLAAIANLFTQQLHSLMILSVVATATVLTVQEFRYPSKP